MTRFAPAIALLTLAAGTVSAAEFLPLAAGNTWTYKDATTGGSFDVRVGTPVYLHQSVYYTLSGYTPEPVMVRVNEYGNIVYWDEERQMDILLTSFEIVPGGKFEAGRRQCPELGQTAEKRGIHDGPAGRWSVLEIYYEPYTCADAGDQLEQYTENIGMVRRVVNTIAGPRTFDLVYARVGNQVISAGKSGTFSIAVTPGTAAGTWLATLRISQVSGSGLKLRFPSGQEYDVRLRDAEGKVLWTWSADKSFVQASHELANVSEWSAAVTVPNPPAIPEGGQVYTFEAWLTTVVGDPQFAAATTVEVAASAASGLARVGGSRR